MFFTVMTNFAVPLTLSTVFLLLAPVRSFCTTASSPFYETRPTRQHCHQLNDPCSTCGKHPRHPSAQRYFAPSASPFSKRPRPSFSSPQLPHMSSLTSILIHPVSSVNNPNRVEHNNHTILRASTCLVPTKVSISSKSLYRSSSPGMKRKIQENGRGNEPHFVHTMHHVPLAQPSAHLLPLQLI